MKDKYKDTIWAIIIWLFTIILTAFLSRNCGSNNNSHEIEYVDSNHTYHQIYTIGDFDKIKDMNKELYDSLKNVKIKFHICYNLIIGNIIVQDKWLLQNLILY